MEINGLRIKFLNNCSRAGVIPKFLKFRIPNNGCFDEKSVHDFQLQLLKKEVQKAKNDLQSVTKTLDTKRYELISVLPEKCVPSVALHTRNSRVQIRKEQLKIHNEKLTTLSEEQQRPLFNVHNTVVTCGLEKPPPSYVMETLPRSQKCSVRPF